MAGWDDLPNETIMHIFKYLGTKYAVQDTLNASIVCRRFHAILEPEIYRHVHVPSSDVPHCCPDEEGREYKKLRHLVRTLIARPELGRLVRTVHINLLGSDQMEAVKEIHEQCGFDEGLCERPHLHEIRHNIFLAEAAKRGLPDDLFDHGVPGLAVLLLHFLPNLHSLSMDAWESSMDVIGEAALGRLGGGVPAGLKSICVLDLFYDDEDLEFSPDTILSFLTLPGLVELTLLGYASNDDTDAEEGIEQVLAKPS